MYEVDGDYFRLITPALIKAVGNKVDPADQDGIEGRAERIPEGAQRLIAGPASTPARDMQGEIVEPTGLDLSYFKLHGRINWDHGRSPSDIIGQPVDWKLTKKGLWLRALLYHGVIKADDAWKLFEAGATLAWSVEGKVIQRDPADPSRVLRAYVINVALTPNPVCQETYAEKANSVDRAADNVLSKTLTTSSGAVLIGQSLDGDGKPRRPYEEVLEKHIGRVLGVGFPICDCVSRTEQAGRFVHGYEGALAHFFGCCGATPDQAVELAVRHERIAQATGVLLKGER